MKKLICILFSTAMVLTCITSCNTNTSNAETTSISGVSLTSPTSVATAVPLPKVTTTTTIQAQRVTEETTSATTPVVTTTEPEEEIVVTPLTRKESGYEILGITTDVVNFRIAPSMESEIIKSIDPNTQVFITDLNKRNNFYNVNINNVNGYISSQFVTTQTIFLIATEDTSYFVCDTKTDVLKGFELISYEDTNGNCRDVNGNLITFDATKFSEKSEYLKSILETSDKKLLTSFTTYYSLSDYYAGKAYNINLVCTEINDVVILKGSNFDWHRSVGNTNKNEGYHLANIYSGGEIVQGYGGGVCQMSSTIYNCVLNLDLEVIERHPHGMAVYYVDWANGKDASVDDIGGFNFIFKNTSEYDIVMKAYTGVEPENEIDTQGSLTVEFYGLIY